MGTRGAFGYRVDGQDKVMYNHFDSYPDGLGSDMVDYVGAHSDSEIAEAARRIVLIDGRGSPPRELIERYIKFADFGVSRGKPTEWYVLLREVQRNPEAFHNGLDHMIDSREFLKDSLFCEWAYIVNVDDGCLEVYRGFNKDPNAPGRYAALQEARPTRVSQEYRGVRLLLTVPFEKLRGLAPGDKQALLDGWEKAARTEDDDE